MRCRQLCDSKLMFKSDGNKKNSFVGGLSYEHQCSERPHRLKSHQGGRSPISLLEKRAFSQPINRTGHLSGTTGSVTVTAKSRRLVEKKL